MPFPVERTARLSLHPSSVADLEAVHALYSDERVWTHFPSGRFTDPERTRTWLRDKQAAWERDGLGMWTVREGTTGALLGHGGCEVRRELFWNLGYRFDPQAQGHGFATELALHSLARARETRPELPVVAYLLEHNAASAAVARKVGLELVHRGPDAGNPDPEAIRLVFADRALTPAELGATLA